MSTTRPWRGSRQGSALFFVAAVLLVIEALALSFHGRSLDTNRLARRAHSRDLSAHLAEAARATAVAALRSDGLRAGTSPFMDLLTTEKDCARLESREVPLPKNWDLEILNQAKAIGATVSTKVRFADVALLDGADLAFGIDRSEKKGHIEIRVSVTVRSVELSYLYRVPFKAVNLIPPVVSKFTLFVKNPERTDATSAGYNRYRNFFGGDPVSTVGNLLPLVLVNEQGLGLAEHVGRGYVFLGGDAPVRLHVTSGSDALRGESFLFQATTEMKEKASGGIDPRSTELLGRYSREELDFYLRRSYQGFFVRDASGQDMNAGNRLKKEFASGRTMASNLLHLYGSWQRRSPTLVVGAVYRAYAFLTALIVDTDRDRQTDAVISILPSLDWHDYPWQIPLLPRSIESRSHPGQMIDVRSLKSLDPSMHDYVHLFGDHQSYVPLMSRIVDDESYNCSYDFAAGYRQGELGAAHAFPASAYPCSGRAYKIDLANGEPHFRGDLNSLSMSALEGRTVCQVADEAEFLTRFVRAGHLRLGRVVRIETGELTLPSRLVVDEGGVVMVPGNVTSNGVKNDSNIPLTLCSLEGSIEINSSYRDHEFSSIALSGGLKNGGRDALVLKGSVAVSSLASDDLKHGGELAYDPRLDPTATSYRNFYRGYVGDMEEEWELP